MTQQPDPQQPDQPTRGGTPPRTSRRTLWIVLACVGGLVVLCCGGAAVVAAIGATIKPAAVSATRAAQPVRPRPSTTATPRPSKVAPTMPAPTTAAAAAAQPARPDYAAASRILTASEQHYRDQLAEGQHAFNTAAFAPWYQRETQDLQMDDAFKQADAYFNADNEPASIETWRADMTDATSAFFQWATAALNGETGAGGPGTTTDQMRQYESKFREGLAAADKDAAAVAVGK